MINIYVFIIQVKMENKNEIAIITEENIADKIYFIRGQKVMLDFDLAEIYGYSTKTFNQQVKRNIEKFEGEDFMFQLTTEEVKELSRSHFVTLDKNIETESEGNKYSRSQNATLDKNKGRGSNIKYMPYAFTEQGIYMLMTVLKGELAIKQSRALVRTFKKMKDYIIENQNLIGAKEILQLSIQTNQNTKDIIEIKENMATKKDFQKIMENFIDLDTYKHFLIMNGQKIEADIAYNNIYKTAKKIIYVVDNYINLKTLELLRVAKNNIKIIIFSDNLNKKDRLTKNMFDDFKNDYPNIDIEFKITDGKYHDRYIAIDYNTKNEKIYHCGASSKDAGNKITTISRIDDTKIYHIIFDELLKNKNLKL